MHVFLVTRWDGPAVESREVRPRSFAVGDIPYDQMWQDSAHWLPRVLAGERVRARFTFGEDNETIEWLEMEP